MSEMHYREFSLYRASLPILRDHHCGVLSTVDMDMQSIHPDTVRRMRRHITAMPAAVMATEDRVTLLRTICASSPRREYILVGLDRAVEYFSSKPSRLMVSYPRIQNNFIMTLYSLFRYNPGSDEGDRYGHLYYSQAAFLLFAITIISHFSRDMELMKSTDKERVML